MSGSSNDKYFPRGDNFWNSFTKDPGADQYLGCLNAGETAYNGNAAPTSVTPPPGYQQGTAQDGAIYYSTNGLRVAADGLVEEKLYSVKIHPNPAQEELIVSVLLTKKGEVPIRILDLQGKLHQQHMLDGIAGRNEKVLRIGSLPTGMYIVEVILGPQRIIHKLVKE